MMLTTTSARLYVHVLLAGCMSCVCAAAAAQVSNAGDALARHGIELDVELTADAYALVAGGIDPGIETPSNLDLIVDIDTAAAGWWRDGRMHLYVLGNAGGDPTQRTGDIQTASNIEAFNTLKVYEFSYEHTLMRGGAALLIGLHDMNADFYALEHAGLFQNSSFGIGPELSQTAPSIFPTTALGMRLNWFMSEAAYLSTAVYGGVPGSRDDQRGTHIRLDSDDGLFRIAELGLQASSDNYMKLAFGGWHHDAPFEDLAGNTLDYNTGVYLLAERDLWRSVSGRGVGIFTQLGRARPDRNLVANYASAGLTVTGLLASRPADTAGIAIAHARGSEQFHSVNPGMDSAETVVELSYRFAPIPWLSLQPDLQYIQHPGFDPTLDEAWVATLRMQLVLF